MAIGDVNGDGYADVIIGAPWGRPPPTFPTVGIVYVVFGKSGTWGAAGNQLLNVGSGNLIDGSQGVRFNGTVVNTQVGTSVATGDVNGDGYADIVMGGYAANLKHRLYFRGIRQKHRQHAAAGQHNGNHYRQFGQRHRCLV